LLLFALENAVGQQLITRRLSTAEGLPSSEVYSVMQDSRGYIWFGTDKGLARYDGTNFKVFSTEDGLPSNTIFKVFEDIDSNLWFSTMSDSLVFMNRNTFKPFRYNIVSGTRQSSNILPYIIGVDEQGKHWMNSLFYNTILEERENQNFSWIHSNNQVTPDDGTYYLAKLLPTNGRYQPRSILHQHGMSKEVFDSFEVNTSDSQINVHGPFFAINKVTPNDNSFYFYRTRSDEIFGCHSLGYHVLFNKTKVLSHGMTSIKNISSFYEDKEGNFWLGSPEGVTVFEKGDFSMPPKRFLTGSNITDIIQDDEGNFWFSDLDNGVIMSPNVAVRELITHTEKPLHSVCFRLHKEDLYFSTIEGGIWKIKPDYSIHNVYQDNRRPYDFYPFEFFDNDDICLPGGAIMRDGLVVKEPKSAMAYTADKCMRLINGELVVGISQGVLKYNSSGEIIFDSHRNSQGSALDYEKRTNAILEDGTRLWLGTPDGLMCLKDSVYENFKRFHPALASRIMSLERISDDLIAVGTKGSGLVLFNTKNKTGKQLTVSNGLIGKIVNSIKYHDGHLYVGTNRGMSAIEFSSTWDVKNIRNFDVHNALPSNEINDIAIYNNQIWLATNVGIAYFQIQNFGPNSVPPPIIITTLTANDSTINMTGTIALGSSQRKLSFTYHGISYRASNRLSYKYILKGHNSDTAYTDNKTAYFSNVGPGNHTFYVWAKNEEGIWSNAPASISIKIPRKFTETFVFYTLLSLLLVGLILGMARYMNYRNQLRIGNELKSSELRLQALTALMDPHFVYNTLAAIQNFINSGDHEQSSLFLSKFARLVRQNLQTVRDGVVELEAEIERLNLYLEIEKMRFGDKLNYAINIHDDQDIDALKIPSMILQPFVENAIWHGILPLAGEGKIEINFFVDHEDTIEIYIKDNGPGIDSKQSEKRHHTSISMQVTSERLELLSKMTGKDFFVEAKNREDVEGTVVYIKLPFMNS